jgi:hypothetical protein
VSPTLLNVEELADNLNETVETSNFLECPIWRNEGLFEKILIDVEDDFKLIFLDDILVDKEKNKLAKYEQWKTDKKKRFVNSPKRWSKWLFLKVEFLIHFFI